MDPEQTKATVLRFNDFISARDIEGLSQMMSDDHTFIDSENNTVVGKPACIQAWQGFFRAFPDYRNDFAHLSVKDQTVVIVGRSSCSDPRLEGPALWTAKVRGRLIEEWRVFADTPSNRAKLGLAG